MMQGICRTKVRDNESSRILKRRLDFKPILFFFFFFFFFFFWVYSYSRATYIDHGGRTFCTVFLSAAAVT